MRITALHRAVADLQKDLDRYGFTVDLEKRMLYAREYGTFHFHDYMAKATCASNIRFFMRLADTDAKAKAEMKQGKLI